MRKGTVLNLKYLHFFDGLAKNKLMVLLFFAFIIGAVVGTATYSKSDNLISFSEAFLSDFLNDRIEQSFFNIFISSLFSGLLFLLALFLSGTSLLGIILSPLLIALRGFLYSNMAAYLYSEYSIKGVAFCAVIIIPVAVINCLAFFWAAKYSMSYSYVISYLTLPHSAPANLYEDFKNFCIKYSFLIIVVIFAALTDAVLSKSLIETFNL